MQTRKELVAHHTARLEKEAQDMIFWLGPKWTEREKPRFGNPESWEASVTFFPFTVIKRLESGGYNASIRAYETFVHGPIKEYPRLAVMALMESLKNESDLISELWLGISRKWDRRDCEDALANKGD